MTQTLMLLLCLSFYIAAAARSRGLSEESTFWLGLSRPGWVLEPMLIVFAMALIAVASLLVGMKLGGDTGAEVGLAVAVPIWLVIMARVWPVFSVGFFFEGRYRWSGSASAYIWHGPGLGRALAISRLPLAKRRVTPTFLIALLALVLPLLAAQWLWGPGFLVNLAFYAMVLPYLSMLNLDLTVWLLAEEERLGHAAA